MVPNQPQSDPVQQQMQGGTPQGQTGVAAPARPDVHYRVTHSSGETVCLDLATARALQQQKPGAKIFRAR